MTRRCHLSGDHVVPNEDEVDGQARGDAQRAVDALQVRCDVWQGGGLCPAGAAHRTQTQRDNLSGASQFWITVWG